MKKLIGLSLLALAFATFMLIPCYVRAAESTTWATDHLGGGLMRTRITWVAAAGGTTTETTFTSFNYNGTTYSGQAEETAGYLLLAVVDPGATAPADNYEILITDLEGVNIFGTALDALDTANSEDWEPDIAYRPFQWPIAFDQESGGGANNANCNGEIDIYWVKAKKQ